MGNEQNIYIAEATDRLIEAITAVIRAGDETVCARVVPVLDGVRRDLSVSVTQMATHV